MSGLPIYCPVCRANVTGAVLLVGPFPCPTCKEQLRITSAYATGVGVFSVLLSALLAFTFGLRGFWLCLATIVLWFPLQIVELIFLLRILPPRLKRFVPKGT